MNKAKLVRKLIIVSMISIILLIIILISLWSAYIENQKQIKSSIIISIVKLSILNSDNKDMNDTVDSITKYIGDLPDRKIAIYDDKYNLRIMYPEQEETINIREYPELFNSLETSDTGHKIFHIGNINEDIFWDWIISEDGSRQLLVMYGMTFDTINEFSFVFIISYLLILFLLILVILIYLNDKYDYFISLSNLYNLSMRCDD